MPTAQTHRGGGSQYATGQDQGDQDPVEPGADAQAGVSNERDQGEHADDAVSQAPPADPAPPDTFPPLAQRVPGDAHQCASEQSEPGRLPLAVCTAQLSRSIAVTASPVNTRIPDA